ncbi:hypothetical protein AcV7_006851 [Taiwanofungus camphoratus]|nr:hypothetical protein AcV7_006851 [Antrodia cinnamomea]
MTCCTKNANLPTVAISYNHSAGTSSIVGGTEQDPERRFTKSKSHSSMQSSATPTISALVSAAPFLARNAVGRQWTFSVRITLAVAVVETHGSEHSHAVCVLWRRQSSTSPSTTTAITPAVVGLLPDRESTSRDGAPANPRAAAGALVVVDVLREQPLTVPAVLGP